MLSEDTDSLKAVIPDETTLRLAQRIVQLTDVVCEEGHGNGEITVKLQVRGGKISQLFSFAGKLFSGSNSKKRNADKQSSD